MKPLRFPLIRKTFNRAASTQSGTYNPKYVNLAKSGKDNFVKDFENSHVKTTLFQKLLLGVGSGVISITSPSRGDMIAVMGEVTGYQAWEYIQSKMLESKEGRQILEEKPRISSVSVDLEKLKSYPDGTLGKAYSNFLTRYGYTPDSRNAVQFVDDLELAYVAQRYREAHDLFHTLLDMPTNMLGEVTVKWVEAIQLKLPMCAAGALFGSVRLAPKFTRAYSTISIVKIDSEVSEKLENQLIKPKEVPGAMYLPTVKLPEFYLKAISVSMKGQSKRFIRRNGEILKQKLFIRPLPIEPVDEKIQKKKLYRELKNEYTDEYGCIRWFDLDREVERRFRHIFMCNRMLWSPIRYDLSTAFQYLVSRSPGEYAVLKRIFKEIAKRDETFAPQTLLDFGSGVGTVNWAAHEFWGNTIEEYYSADISEAMHDLAEMILTHKDSLEEPYIKKVYYRTHLPLIANPYDIVVSAFSLGELSSRSGRISIITKLWNFTKKYLVVVENGNIPGFKMISEVRDYLIEANKNHNISCHIFAPCPHEMDCPILVRPRTRPVCKFEMKYENIKLFLKGKVSSFDFSYIVFKKGEDPPSDRKCRLIRKVLKKHKHIHCTMCTTNAEYKEVVVTKSKHGKIAFNCMKKAKWGDLLSGYLEERPKIQPVQHELLPSQEEVTPDEGEDSEECYSSDEYHSDEDSEESGDESDEKEFKDTNTESDKKSE